jgi:cysteine desulfurase
MNHVYLDYNASTPVDPRVSEFMHQATTEHFGNPSSSHWAGKPALATLERARRQVADLLECKPGEIVFTSGGSESNNLALKGLFFARQKPQAHIITTQIEHPAVVQPCRFLERLGARISWLPVDSEGCIDPDDLHQAISADTVLVSIMHANNEVGTVEPIEECSVITRQHGVPLHVDAAQSAGKILTRVDELGADLLSIAGHKMYAPKGTGALYVREGTILESLLHGAGHERGRRAGTESALLAGALGAACEIARDLSPMTGVQALRDRLWNRLQEGLGDRVLLLGHPEKRLPNTLNVCFTGHIGAEILDRLPGLAASTGSACHSGSVELSPVLEAMGVPPEQGAGAIRFSLGRQTTREEIDTAAMMVLELLNGLR